MKPYNINDIADYIIDCLTSDEPSPLIHLKLQKLLYYIQAWSLGIEENIMFEGKFQAWVHGPVNRIIYNRFIGKSLYGFINRDDIQNPAYSISENDKSFVNYILDNYAGYSGSDLEKMTHQEVPWIEARGNLSPTERCTVEISENTMKLYYGKRWKELNG